MIRTVVCEKEGCTGNSFYVENKDHKLSILCTECNSAYEYEYNEQGFILLSNCSSCKSEKFKVFRDTEIGKIYAKCIECGNPPEKICTDIDGNQISYNEKILLEVKDIVSRLEQNMMNLEIKFENLESNQSTSEMSLRYIMKFLTERN
ncbi:MAG: hypothetical protein ACRC6T_05120 [Sarcina sp.]